MDLGKHALRLPAPGTTSPLVAQGDRRRGLRYGVGHTFVPARLLVAYVTSSKHQRAGGLAMPKLDHERPIGFTFLVSYLAFSGMADFRGFTVCYNMPKHHSAEIIYIADSTSDSVFTSCTNIGAE